ncbi:hypothetical protein B4127_1479 [Bacillus pumilus]|uniref:Uncharacterized protein n=1 Tax=Bacillus pumilus TaxID=1408 RepID=A0AB34QR62_BACPU|nr:hypothetical protein [Bacillus pumilus]KIL12148.1 hypothetical protein B4127_1479 [Bacillus pumilus]
MNNQEKQVWNGFFIGLGAVLLSALMLVAGAVINAGVIFYSLNFVLSPLVKVYGFSFPVISLAHSFVIGVLLVVFVKGSKNPEKEEKDTIFKVFGKGVARSAFVLLMLYIASLFI